MRAVKEAPARTGLMFLGTRGGEREVVGYRRVEDEIFVAPPVSARPRLVHFASLTPVLGVARAQRASARTLAARDAIITVDLNARPRIWRGAAARVDKCLELVHFADIVKCSADDLVVLGLGEEKRAIAGLLDRMRPEATLLVTRGAGAITARGPFGAIHRDVRVVRGAQETGAGDAFMAGVIAELFDSTEQDRLDTAFFRGVIARGAAFAKRWIQR